MSGKKRNKEDTITKIINETKILLTSKNYDEITTNMIAENVHISVGTLYHHFPKGKDEIMQAIYKNDISFYLDDDFINELSSLAFEKLIFVLIEKLYIAHEKEINLFKSLTIITLLNPNLEDIFMKVLKKRTGRLSILFKSFPELKHLTKKQIDGILLFLFNIFEGIIHRNLFYKERFIDKDKLLKYLTSLTINTFLHPDFT